MADSERQDARKTTTFLVIATFVVLIVVGGIIAVRGCHEPNDMEERIDPDDQLPGTIDGTGSNGTPDVAPLLRAA